MTHPPAALRHGSTVGAHAVVESFADAACTKRDTRTTREHSQYFQNFHLMLTAGVSVPLYNHIMTTP